VLLDGTDGARSELSAGFSRLSGIASAFIGLDGLTGSFWRLRYIQSGRSSSGMTVSVTSPVL
jgi:hypothetical protein